MSIEKLILNDSFAEVVFANSNEGSLLAMGMVLLGMPTQKALEMFKYSYDELVGQKIEVLVPTDLRKKPCWQSKELSKGTLKPIYGCR